MYHAQIPRNILLTLDESSVIILLHLELCCLLYPPSVWIQVCFTRANKSRFTPLYALFFDGSLPGACYVPLCSTCTPS